MSDMEIKITAEFNEQKSSGDVVSCRWYMPLKDICSLKFRKPPNNSYCMKNGGLGCEFQKGSR